MGKVLKIIFGIIGGLLVLFIALVVALGISIYDKTDNSNAEIESNPKELTTLLYADIENALDDTDNTHEVDLLLTEYKTNYLLNAVKNEISIPLLTIKSIYAIYNEDGTVRFEAPVEFMFFKSCLKGDVDMAMSDDGEFSITISGLNVGKFGTDSAFIKNIIFNSINTENINNDLKNANVGVTVSKTSSTITASITKDNIITTVNSLLSSGDEYLITALVEEFVGNKSIFDFKFNDDDYIGAILYLETLKATEGFKYDLEKTSTTLEDLKAKSVTLINNGVMTPSNSTTIFDYLVRGYDALSDSEKEVIDALSFTTVGIPFTNQYKGIIERSSLTMAKVFLDAFSIDPTNYLSVITQGYFDITISEDNLNELFNSFDFIGTSFAFIDDDKLAYITIESLYTEISDDKMDVYMVVNVNGYEIEAKINLVSPASTDALVTLKVDTLYLGSNELNESVRYNLLKYLENVLNSVEFLEVNAEEETMSLDFSSYLSGTFYDYLKEANFTKMSFEFTSESKGKLILRLSSK